MSKASNTRELIVLAPLRGDQVIPGRTEVGGWRGRLRQRPWVVLDLSTLGGPQRMVLGE